MKSLPRCRSSTPSRNHKAFPTLTVSLPGLPGNPVSTGRGLLDRPVKPGDDSVVLHATEDHDVPARRASPANPDDAHRQPAPSRRALSAVVRADDGAAL